MKKGTPESLALRREQRKHWSEAQKEHFRAMHKAWELGNPEKRALYRTRNNRKRYQRLKEKIFDKLGHFCKRCGMADKRVLCIDHVFGGGTKELRENRNQERHFKRVLADTGGNYQILCHNCNWIKRHENKEMGGKKHRFTEEQLKKPAA